MASETDNTSPPSDAAPQAPMPQISLPKGGGALQGIGEKFSTNGMTGTAALTIPIAVSPARSGFTPQLMLSYDSGGANDVCGMGMGFSIPSIVWKTDKGLPRYRYNDKEESGVFILTGNEDLVPVLCHTGGVWGYEDEERDGFRIRRYRPRIEGLFARIERWMRVRDGDVHWRSFTKDNIQTIYGDTPESRVSDPEQPGHIFRWLVSSTYDGKGNASSYEYVAENLNGVDSAAPSERGRQRPTNRYLKRIRYGNRTPVRRYRGPSHRDGLAQDWMFEVVLDYGDEGYRVFHPADGDECVRFEAREAALEWPVRLDPFSTYRAGFEIRTYRLCRRVLVFHHFPGELGPGRYLVRSTEFHHDQKPLGSFLTRVVQSGYTRLTGDAYRKRSLPALDLSYSGSPLEAEDPGPFDLRDVESDNLPQGIDGTQFRWVDLDGEGIAGVLSEWDSSWYFKHNLGDGRFGAASLVAHKPASPALNTAEVQLLDVGGDGQLDLVDLSRGAGGFYERARDPDSLSGVDSEWSRFRAFQSLPRLDWTDPDLRFVDLTGDGIADILITEDVAFRWHPSLGEEGFGPAVRIPAPPDEDDGPRIVFSDPIQSIYLADMSGDGLTDIVRIRNGEACYWPNLGYGRFGAKIVLDASPWFDTPDLFDSRQIRLADTDGSGTTDILYITPDEIHVYLNQSGNSLSARRVLQGLPAPGARFIAVFDFLGRGTACLVWSSPLRSYDQHPLRYVDLMRGEKPYLLTRVANNMGAETVVEYASSTEFYLADKAAGKPWITSLPFPVQVVKRVEKFDTVSQHCFVSSSSYHHGYYDPVEREFRGFGRIDKLDTEQFSTGAAAGRSEAANDDIAWRAPPALTRTWYHTGVFLRADRVSRLLAHEYYQPPDETDLLLPDTILPSELLPEEAREACRSLKGTVLREEVYGLDGSKSSERPYSVTESNSTVRMLQPRSCNLHCVFFTHPREVLTLNFERRLYEVDHTHRTDPRISHAVTLLVDQYGNALQSANIYYGRRFPDRSHLVSDADRAIQAKVLATFAESRYTNAVDKPDDYRTPLPAHSRSYELVHPRRAGPGHDSTRPMSFREIRQQIARAGDGHHASGPDPYRRLLEESRVRYRRDSLEGLLPVGDLESLALSGESYSLAFTPTLLAQVYADKLPEPGSVLGRDGGYADIDGDGRWWTVSGRVFYSPDTEDNPATELAYARGHFFLPQRFRDAFGNVSYVTYDSHDLAPIQTRDPLENIVRAELDYRALGPRQVTDPNGNRTQVAFDSLGQVAGTAVMGKAGEHAGDSLEGFVADLSEQVMLEHLRHPLADPGAILGKATTRQVYDRFAFERTRHESQPQPAVSYGLARETHVSDLAPGATSRIQHSFQYSDGFGRVIQTRSQAEPDHGGEPRWIGSGWTIFNNKGSPVRKFEPYFSDTHRFKFAAISGVADTLLYDPLGRAVGTLHPNHTFEKTRFDPWYQESWDVNDTVLINPVEDPDIGPLLRHVPKNFYSPTWYDERRGGALGAAEQGAAEKTAEHAGTPTRVWLDPLARTFLSVAENRFRRTGEQVKEFYASRTEFDIEGNARAVTDPRGRVIMTYDYDFLRRKLRQNSSDAGERWIVSDISGKPLLTFNSRDFRLRYDYDSLRRPTTLFVRHGDRPETLAERIEYGESQPEAARHNLLTKAYRQFDGAGILTLPSYDFKGNLLRSTRQVAVDFRNAIDWADSPRLESAVFANETSYDALNRTVSLTAPDRSVTRPAYNERNLLRHLEVSLKRTDAFSPYVMSVTYNAKGQRERIEYGNGACTVNDYDPLTFRLIHLQTSRKGDAVELQNLSYAYDPAGNLTSMGDAAQQAVYFKNRVVKANGDYLYDAVYRLIQASGREHDSGPTNWDDRGRVNLHLPGDGHAMRHYREHYTYDAVGNIEELLHEAGPSGTWRREYHYGQIESNNHLTRTSIGQAHEGYGYDPDGNMVRMAHLPRMQWDFKDQLTLTQTQVVNGDHEPASTFYRYDSAGQRVRKVAERGHGTRHAERLYIGAGFEVYREYAPDGETVALERTTLHVMDDRRRIALAESLGEDVTVRYQFDNQLQSACLELDESSAIITYEEYYPYGSTSYQAGRSHAEVSHKRYRFLARERDLESGLNYHGARYYATWLGRWTSCDPAGIAATLNGLAYGRGNPLRFVDPGGMQDFDKYGWPKGASFISPAVDGAAGTQAHQDVLPFLRDRINSKGSYYTADIDVPTLPGGSYTKGSNEAGEIDLSVWASAGGDHIVDLKHLTSGQNALAQTTNYSLHNDSVFASRPNDRPLTDFAEDIHDPVSVNGRNYLLSSDPKTPYRIDYYPYRSSTASTPQVYLKFPLTGSDTESAAASSNSGQLASVEPLQSTAPPPLEDESFASPPPLDIGSTSGGGGGAPLNILSPFTTLVAGSGESLMTLEAGGFVASQLGWDTLAGASLAGARAPGPAVIGGVVGAPAGYAYEAEARQLGLGKPASIAVGAGGAFVTGAAAAGLAVLAVATAPVSLPVLAGAALAGGLAAGYGYLMSRSMHD